MAALHAKAKESPNFRFYALYDKVYRKDVLAFAYECCKANGGAAGVDGQTFEDIKAYGTERWLDELAQELKSRTYRPLPVRRVYIPKPDGKQRPLGVPAIRDRCCRSASKMGSSTRTAAISAARLLISRLTSGDIKNDNVRDNEIAGSRTRNNPAGNSPTDVSRFDSFQCC